MIGTLFGLVGLVVSVVTALAMHCHLEDQGAGFADDRRARNGR